MFLSWLLCRRRICSPALIMGGCMPIQVIDVAEPTSMRKEGGRAEVAESLLVDPQISK